jgi:hypothetical protein
MSDFKSGTLPFRSTYTLPTAYKQTQDFQLLARVETQMQQI